MTDSHMNEADNQMDDEQMNEQVAVHRVAGYLDEDVPGWAQELVDAYDRNLGSLQINNLHNCVLAALFDNYNAGVDRVFASRNINIDDSPLSDAVGHYWVNSDVLREAWLVEVNARLGDARLG